MFVHETIRIMKIFQDLVKVDVVNPACSNDDTNPGDCMYR